MICGDIFPLYQQCVFLLPDNTQSICRQAHTHRTSWRSVIMTTRKAMLRLRSLKLLSYAPKQLQPQWTYWVLLTLFWAGSGITILGGGRIMARMDSSHPEAVCRHPKAQKWLSSNFFDLWLSIDTKKSTLWVVVLANPAFKRPWWKMKIFMQKYVKI